LPWVRLDDKFWRNKKMQKLSHAARGAWVTAVSFCADTNEPTGFLTYKEAEFFGTKKLVAELRVAVVYEPVNGGYLIHDFDHYLDRGSRDRCRKWREAKRLEGVTSDADIPSQVTQSTRPPGVTGTLPRATGLETISTSGFYPSPSRPEPEGVKPLQDNGLYGLQATAMHVEGLHPLKETLKNLRRQSVPHKEAI